MRIFVFKSVLKIDNCIDVYQSRPHMNWKFSIQTMDAISFHDIKFTFWNNHATLLLTSQKVIIHKPLLYVSTLVHKRGLVRMFEIQ